MRMLMPSHVKNVKLYKDPQPIFTRYGIESQLDAMFSPVVQLRSGGYIVINQAEALVAIDVNSGRATREHHIEDTALKTNVEAAEEIARQLRLRDLAGLIVIDFIDMDESRNNRTVERRLKEALKHDRARIQVGRISHFGLLEMSRQRIRTSVLESSTEKCPVCGGSGHVRSVSSVALQCLRALEEMLLKGATHNLIVRTRSEVALYVLNHKRAHLRELEERFHLTLTVSADPTVTGQQSFVIDRGEQVHTPEAARSFAQAVQSVAPVAEEEPEAELSPEAEVLEASEAPEVPGESSRESEREHGLRRRRRRGRGRGRGGEPRESGQPVLHDTVPEHAVAHEDHDASTPAEEGFEAADEGAPARAAHEVHPGAENGGERDGRRRRRRGRRGGRRNRPRNGEGSFQPGNGGGEEPELQHVGADFPPVSDEDASAISPPFDEGPEPATEAAPVTPPPAPEAPPAAVEQPSAQEALPRRRSTIREPAPFAARSAEGVPAQTLPPPAPVISVSSSEEPAQPKRGWWAKKLLGDKS
jgi:ribonuclease E